MVLGKLPVPGRPTIWMVVGQGPIALAVGAGGGCLDIFTLLYPFSPLSPSLWETARYRLKYCLKGPLNPKQPTKQPTLPLVESSSSDSEMDVNEVHSRHDFPKMETSSTVETRQNKFQKGGEVKQLLRLISNML